VSGWGPQGRPRRPWGGAASASSSAILPNVISPIVIQTAVCLSYGILIESALWYLGVGVQPPTPSWGTILNEGKESPTLAPWVSLFRGAFIMLGDGLRDALDPRAEMR
jgi:peptide/nickel transport system permease protein